MGDEQAASETDATEQQPTPPAKGNENQPETGRLPDDHPVVLALKKANDEAAAARVRLKEIEDADKTDLERATEGLAAEKARAKRLADRNGHHQQTGNRMPKVGTGSTASDNPDRTAVRELFGG